MEKTKYPGVYANKKSIVIRFTYRGIRRSETYEGVPTAERLKWAAGKLDCIKFAISTNQFDYAKEFPNSAFLKTSPEFRSKHISIKEAADLWIQRNYRNWKASTYKGYMGKLNPHILPNWGHLKVDEFKPSMFKDWAAAVKLSPKSINEVRSLMIAIFEEQFIDEVISVNPMKRTKQASLRKKEPEPFYPHERDAILQALPDGFVREYFEFNFWTGLRTGEMIGLKWSHVDLPNKRIFIRETVVNGKITTPKTASSERTHLLHPTALAVLERLQRNNPASDQYVFLDPRTNQRWKSDLELRERFWRPALKQANVKYRKPYNCRHTYASTLLTAGAIPLWVAKQMGHTDCGQIRANYGRHIGDEHHGRGGTA